MNDQYKFNTIKMQELSDELLKNVVSLHEIKECVEKAMLLSDGSSDTEYRKVQRDLDALAVSCKKLSNATLDISNDLEKISLRFTRELEENSDNVRNLRLL